MFGTSDQKQGLTLFKICKFFDYSKMSLLSFSKPPFEKTISSNDKINVFVTEKEARNILGSSDQKHGLTPFKICKCFDCSIMCFLSSIKAPFEKQHDQTTRPMSLLEKSKLKRYLELLSRSMG